MNHTVTYIFEHLKTLLVGTNVIDRDAINRLKNTKLFMKIFSPFVRKIIYE